MEEEHSIIVLIMLHPGTGASLIKPLANGATVIQVMQLVVFRPPPLVLEVCLLLSKNQTEKEFA
jgi:hypothetical protein